MPLADTLLLTIGRRTRRARSRLMYRVLAALAESERPPVVRPPVVRPKRA